MIKFEKIKFKNILHFGNNITEFNIPNGITRIFGANGAGKSSIIDILNFALFGKPYRKIKLDQLINNINNKDLLVELYFTIKSDNYKIIRGIKPNIFEIYKNDSLISLSSHNKDYQNYLETKILYFDEELFNQTVIKSLTKNISFINLSKNDKKEIIEKIFDMNVFSIMKDKVTEKLYTFKMDISNIQSEISNFKILIEQEEKHISEIQKLKKNNLEIKMGILEEKIVKVQEKLKDIQDNKPKFNKIEHSLSTKSGEFDILNKEINDLEFQIKMFQEKENTINKICIDCDKKDKILKDFNKKETQELLQSKKEIAHKLKSDIEILKKNYNILLNFINDEPELIKLQEKFLDEKLHFFDNITDEIQEDRTKLEEYKNNLIKSNETYNSLNEKYEVYNIIKDLLNKDIIKNSILNEYLPIINKILKDYLDKFQLPIDLKFENNFELVSSDKFYYNLSYYNLSEGEKKKVDLSIMFTFLDFLNIKNKYSECNLLFLDEVTSGLDSDGRFVLFEILRMKSEKVKIIVIDHTDNSDFYDNMFKIEKSSKFSEIIVQ